LEGWLGAVVAVTLLAGTVLSVIKGGWLALAPFALAGLAVIGLIVYLRWLSRLGP